MKNVGIIFIVKENVFNGKAINVALKMYKSVSENPYPIGEVQAAQYSIILPQRYTVSPVPDYH